MYGIKIMAENDKTFKEICPSVEELLTEVEKNVPCSLPGCGKIFNQASALRMHMVKTHKILKDEKDNDFFYKCKSDKKGLPCHFHCPAEDCKYKKGMERHFTSFRMLKQHYMRVHSEKKYVCNICGYKFGMENNLKRHQSHCGMMFDCETCKCPYTTREALMTHCTRKQHIFPEKYKLSKCTRKSNEAMPSASATCSTPGSQETSEINGPTEHKKLKKSTPHLLAGENLPPVVNVVIFNVNQGTDQVNGPDGKFVPILPKPVQTSYNLAQSRAQNPVIEGRSKTSSMAQTCTQPVDVTSSETQTTGDYVLMKAMQSANIPVQKESKGAQVSPRAKICGVKRSIPTQSASVQTIIATPRGNVKRRRRKKHQREPSSALGSATASTVPQAPVPSPALEMPDFLDFGFSDNETQTIDLIEELEASLAASASTQTRESFLSGKPSCTLVKPEAVSTHLSIETQTLSIDTGDENFSLLNFLNSDNVTPGPSHAACSSEPQASVNALQNFEQPPPLNNLIPAEASLSSALEFATQTSPQIMDVLGAGSSLFDASAQTTEESTAIHTQTIDTMFDQLLSHMETQTSDDLPFPELGFMDNQTQTAFDIELIGNQANVETQTSLHVLMQSSNNVQSIDTETQTLFPSLALTDSHTQTNLADLEKYMNL